MTKEITCPLAAAKAVVELTVRQDMEGGVFPHGRAQAPETSPLGVRVT